MKQKLRKYLLPPLLGALRQGARVFPTSEGIQVPIVALPSARVPIQQGVGVKTRLLLLEELMPLID